MGAAAPRSLVALPPRPAPGPLRGHAAVWLPVAAAATAFSAAAAVRPDQLRLLLAVAILGLLLAISLHYPRVAVAVAVVAYLPALALGRRLLISDAGFVSQDPLLLVGPALALALFARLVLSGEIRLWDDRASKLVTILLAFAAVQIVNPVGIGGPVAGVVGLLFIALPLVWFFLGRALLDRRTVEQLLVALIASASIAALYGLWQTQLRDTLPPWDQAWFELNGYIALVIGEGFDQQIRPFGSFSSNAEYASFLSLGLIASLGFAVHGRLWAIVPAPLLAVAIYLAGNRTVLALIILAALTLVALRARSLDRAFARGLLALVALVAALTVAGPTLERIAASSGSIVAQRSISGLLNPADEDASTAGGHLGALMEGVERGIRTPIGAGNGSTNAGAGVGTGAETDLDVADTFIAFGVLGGLTYIVLVLSVLGTLFLRAVQSQAVARYAVAAIAVVTLGYWLRGNLYSVSPLCWLLFGWATGPDRR